METYSGGSDSVFNVGVVVQGVAKGHDIAKSFQTGNNCSIREFGRGIADGYIG